MIVAIEELIEDVKEQIKNFTDIAVIGLSGGADSTLVAILCTLALGKENVYGVQLPYHIKDIDTFNFRSQKLIKELNINRESYRIDGICDSFISTLGIIENENTYKLTGNIKSRIRMVLLYSYCEELQSLYKNNIKIRVIGTDNYSENFLGYFTKYGDGGVDINPIEELYKSEVYQLLDYFKEKGIITEECINRVPSAGLWEGQTDEDELGMTYDEIEDAIRIYNSDSITHGLTSYPKRQLDVDRIVEKIHWKTQHKREIPPHFKLRQYCS